MNIVDLLDRYLDDRELQAFVLGLGTGIWKAGGEQTYCSFPADGLMLRFDGQSRLTTIFLHATGRDGFAEYAGALPGQVVFADRREDVLRKLGAPSHAGDDVADHAAHWVRYDRPDHSLYVEFDASQGSVAMVTLLTKDAPPPTGPGQEAFV